MRHYLVKGTILHRLGRTQEAIDYTEKVMQVATKTKSIIILNNCKSESSRYYLAIGEIEKAKKLAHEAYDHYEILKLNYPSMTNTRVTLGYIYLEEGSHQTAIKYFNEAVVLAKLHHRLQNHKSALGGILRCNIILNKDPDLILSQLDSFIALKDTLINEDMNSTIQDLRIKYDIEKREDELVQLNNEYQLTNQNLKSAKRINFLYFGTILFLLTSAILLSYLFYNNRKAKKILQGKNDIIAESLTEKQLLLKEIHHRVKNNLQTVSSLLSLQSNYIKDEKVLTALKDGQNRVQSMALIHQNLYQDDDLRNVNVRTYFNKLLSGLYQSYHIDPERIQLTMEIDDIMMDVETIIPLGLITNELVTNVFKYAFPDEERGRLSVKLSDEYPMVLRIKDDGRGIKESNPEGQADSFGYQMINAFCTKLNADLNINSQNGTEITITIKNNEENTYRRR